MLLINRTDFQDYFLRRMISWICQEIELPIRQIKKVTFKKTRRTFSGRAAGRSFIVRIGCKERYPTDSFIRHGCIHPALADQVEGLVSTTAHELYHLWQFRQCNPNLKKLEPGAIFGETLVLKIFRDNRDELMTKWERQPECKAAKAPPPLTEKRAEKASVDLRKWMKKLKLAQTKVKKYKQKVAYYERTNTS